MKIISCTANREIARNIASHLGVQLSETDIYRFSDSEIFVEIKENVRGEEVFVIQPTSCPANDNLMELLIMTDALRRGSAKCIVLVIPYYGYARQDRKTGPRTPISAKLVANLLTQAGADRILTVDLHAMQIQGFFDIPVDHLVSLPVFTQDIQLHHVLENMVVVSPDIGGIGRARALGKRLNLDLVVIDKRRDQVNASEVMNVIGNVEGRSCILIDDIVDTAGTLCNAAEALMKHGARDVSAYITHGVLSGSALKKIEGSCLKELVITDSIEITNFEEYTQSRIRVVSIASLLGKAIHCISNGRSVSSLLY